MNFNSNSGNDGSNFNSQPPVIPNIPVSTQLPMTYRNGEFYLLMIYKRETFEILIFCYNVFLSRF
jgi:hypothetical protein